MSVQESLSLLERCLNFLKPEEPLRQEASTLIMRTRESLQAPEEMMNDGKVQVSCVSVSGSAISFSGIPYIHTYIQAYQSTG